MSNRVLKINRSELDAAQRAAGMWDEVEAIRKTAGLVADDCPDTAFSVIEYARKFELNPSTALNEIRRMAAAGKLKSGRAMRADARGHRGITTVYWPA